MMTPIIPCDTQQYVAIWARLYPPAEPVAVPASAASRTKHRRNPNTELVKALATVAWRYVAYLRNPARIRAAKTVMDDGPVARSERTP
jgi:hypothetical protein